MTPLGAKLRELRRQRAITLGEMARGVGVSSPYLSALEHGKKGRPSWYLIQRIVAYLNIIWDEAEELQRLAEISDPRVTVDTAGLVPVATELSNLLAVKIGGLSEHSLDHLLHQLRVVSARDEA